MNGLITKSEKTQKETSLPSSQVTTALKNSSSAQLNSSQSLTSSTIKPQQDSSSSTEINPNDICSPHELVGWVDDVLEKLEAKFTGVEAEVLQRLDELGKRIDSLELSMSSVLDAASDPNPPANLLGEVSTTSPAGRH